MANLDRLTLPLPYDGESLWNRLCRVRTLRVVAQSAVAGGWNGVGVGRVRVEEVVGNQLVYRESGNWTTSGGHCYRFKNVYRWHLPVLTSELHLEHLRGGIDCPVFLVSFRPEKDRAWVSTRPHRCHQDDYAAELLGSDADVELRWTVKGPNKNEIICYTYT